MKITIRRKLFMGFGVILFFLAVVGYIGWKNARTFSSEFASLYANHLKAAIYLANAERGLWELRFGLPNYMFGDAATREKIKADTSKWLKQVDDNLSGYAALPLTVEEREALKEWEQNYPAYLATRPQFFTLLDAGQLDEAKKFRAQQTNPPAAKAVAALSRLNDLQQKIGAEKERNISGMAQTSMKLLAGLIGVALALGVAISLTISGGVTNALKRVVKVLEAVAGGDFTQRLDLKSRDEVSQMAAALNRAVDGMRNALQQVKAAADQAAVSSQQLSAASEQLSSGAQEQASSLEETAASLEEITGTVKQNADNAKQANQLAMGSRDSAEKGGQVVTMTVEAMGEINKSSKKIADIITTIDEIAFQTNLLALNAAVEAARAGEQGRGFAVVAAEVRNLAQRSATAAKEIKTLIQDSVAKVQHGSELVNRSGQTLEEIVTSVKRVTDIIGEIAAASQEQSSGIDQVNKAVTQMDQVVQSNAAQTEELTSTAQSLASQAQQLQALVGRFNVNDGRQANGMMVAALPAAKTAGLATVKSIATKTQSNKAGLTHEIGPASELAHIGNGSALPKEGEFEEF